MKKLPRLSPQQETGLSVMVVVLVTLLTYAPLIARLGYYRDDWYLLWTAHSQGAEGIMNLFRGDRPFLGWLYIFDYNLLGSAPLNWHMYALFIKILGGLGFLYLLRGLWPEKRIETTLITLLFIVYPGFYQQPNAATFKNLLLAYGCAMFSLALTIRAMQAASPRRQIVMTGLAILLALVYLFIYEALVGIEVVRILLVWYVHNREGARTRWATIRKSLLADAPYLLMALGFVIWRIFIFQSTRRATNVGVVLDEFGPLSLMSLWHLTVALVKDLFETSALAWGVPYYQFSVGVDDRILGFAIALGLAVVTLAGAYVFLGREQISSEAGAERHWIPLGAVIVLVTTLPVVLAGRHVIFAVQWDRYTYQSIAGVVLLIGGLLFHSMQGRMRWALIALLLLSGVITQILSANYYRKFWTVQQHAYWQLSWRAPQIEEGTTLVLILPGEYALAEEYEIWGPVNLLYHPGEPLKIPAQVMYDGLPLELALGLEETRTVRGTVDVQRDYSKVLIVTQKSPTSCLHALDGRRAELAASERVDVQQIASYSNIQWIDPNAAPVIPSRDIFGLEPSHGWCFYYQKIDLARQKQDWEEAVRLADEAAALGYAPEDASEWLPVLEAYLHVGDAKRAKRTALLIRVDKDYYQEICHSLKMNHGTPASYDRDTLFDALCVRE